MRKCLLKAIAEGWEALSKKEKVAVAHATEIVRQIRKLKEEER